MLLFLFHRICKMYKVFFETYGCQMNVSDSEMVADLLSLYGYGRTNSSRDADLVIVNTCSVREKAEQRARHRLLELVATRKKYKKDQQVWVIGCMAQRLGESLKAEIPGLDRVIGAIEIESLHENIHQYLSKKMEAESHSISEGGLSAFVPVMRGCDNFCTYCIVPHVRGREHSVTLKTVKKTVMQLVSRGVKEVTLLGQNVNSYKSEGHDFSDLLEELNDVEGLKRIRFTTSHPADCSEKLMRHVAGLPRVCNHFHLPVQSGSSRVLRLMNRKYTREQYLDRIMMLKEIAPKMDITTDVMVGFPGESEEDFKQTLSLFETVRYTSAFMFAYSPRPGTKAAGMGEEVPREISQKRLRTLIDLQTAITKETYSGMVGKEVSVLATQRQEKAPHDWMGQTFGVKRVLFSCEDDVAGMILPVKVVGSSGMTLIGERL